jgi:hypothetical protein
VSDCLSNAGVLLLWSVAAIVASGLFEAGWNAVGWLTQRLFQAVEPDRYVCKSRISLSDGEMR